jgi:hypothetical protein
MALTLRDVERDPVAKRALTELLHRYTVTEEKHGLALNTKSGKATLYVYDLDDLHQLDFMQRKRVSENSCPTADIHTKPPPKPPISPQQQIEELQAKIERLRASGRKIIDQREEWKRRALLAEGKLAEAVGEGNSEDRDSANRYAALKRYLAKQYHPDHAPGQGIERIVRAEIFKEIWSEIDRLDDRA